MIQVTFTREQVASILSAAAILSAGGTPETFPTARVIFDLVVSKKDGADIVGGRVELFSPDEPGAPEIKP